MKREYRVMTALNDSAVPVPQTEVFHDDSAGDAGVGSPFYLMELVSGKVLTQTTDNACFSRSQLRALSFELAATLAQLHEVDWANIGLADFGRPEGFLQRQAARWLRQFDQSRSRPLPELDELAAQLGKSIPETTMVSLLHGDFRLDNTLVAPSSDGTPHIVTVLDWEMSTIGDSLTDLGLFGLYWDIHSLEGASTSILASAIDPRAGYASFDEMLNHYANSRNLDSLPDISWYLAFASFKLAVILEGIHYRFTQGDTVGDGFDTVGQLVAPLARRGLNYLNQPAHFDKKD
tara:strand:+ start:3146 stop:4018 length:873 start_codon:yes stop_codon:yes gene_type:complete